MSPVLKALWIGLHCSEFIPYYTPVFLLVLFLFSLGFWIQETKELQSTRSRDMPVLVRYVLVQEF